jgi:hypothetical protein
MPAVKEKMLSEKKSEIRYHDVRRIVEWFSQAEVAGFSSKSITIREFIRTVRLYWKSLPWRSLQYSRDPDLSHQARTGNRIAW